ncbi:helix-turn-helix domain-containing protein [Rahnella inusitata]|uniref:helix-turn-helix domain-containing protein n=1 Tax=Rahnella inusitata TaxID=58169 RepID=UPI0039BDD166
MRKPAAAGFLLAEVPPRAGLADPPVSQPPSASLPSSNTGIWSASRVSVSTAAYHVGYTPAHFSVVFRKKFGVSPKSLRG